MRYESEFRKGRIPTAVTSHWRGDRMAPAFNRNGISVTEEQWIYEVRPSEGPWLVAAASLAALIAATMTIVLTRRSHGTVPAGIIMTAGVMAIASRALARTAVSIDRRSGVVSITTAGYLWNKRIVRFVGEFDKVSVWERRKLLSAGDYTSQYSVMLLGGNGPLPLLTTDDENEASTVRDEVAAFLRFR